MSTFLSSIHKVERELNEWIFFWGDQVASKHIGHIRGLVYIRSASPIFAGDEFVRRVVPLLYLLLPIKLQILG